MKTQTLKDMNRTEEAKLLGFKEGVLIEDCNGVAITPKGDFVEKDGVLYFGGATIYKNGTWATIPKMGGSAYRIALLRNKGYKVKTTGKDALGGTTVVLVKSYDLYEEEVTVKY